MRLFSENLLYTMSPVAVSLTCFTVSHVIIEPGITLRCQVRKPISHHIWGGRLNLMTSFVSPNFDRTSKRALEFHLVCHKISFIVLTIKFRSLIASKLPFQLRDF